jgi:hypothetical protein
VSPAMHGKGTAAAISTSASTRKGSRHVRAWKFTMLFLLVGGETPVSVGAPVPGPACERGPCGAGNQTSIYFKRFASDCAILPRRQFLEKRELGRAWRRSRPRAIQITGQPSPRAWTCLCRDTCLLTKRAAIREHEGSGLQAPGLRLSRVPDA